MFDNLQEGFQRAFKTMAGKGKLTEANMQEGLQLVEDTLLEADVNYEVAKQFAQRVQERALGQKVLTRLNPTEQLASIVRDELVNLMGPVDSDFHLRRDLTVIMMCGLQGSGKTTTCGKLARLILDSNKGQDVGLMLVAADLQRPGAVDQLTILGQQVGVSVYAEPENKDPVAVCQNGVRHARQAGSKVVILDTAGRLHVDDALMDELKKIDRKIDPHQVYMVVDGATGQDAVSSARAFNEALSLDGVIMTKLDGDTRGGATLSVKQVTGVPIKFVGTGEHLLDLDPFSPERMADRILGGGDIAGLIEKAQRVIDKDEQEELQKQLAQGRFTLNDFRKQMGMLKRLGSMKKMLGMIPGMGHLVEQIEAMGVDSDQQFKRLGGMIDSMTKAEREDPHIIDHSRRNRIAAGSGVEPHEINQLVKQFDGFANLMKKMGTGDARERQQALQEMMQGATNPHGAPSKLRGSSGKALSAAEKKARAGDRKKAMKELRKQRKGRK